MVCIESGKVSGAGFLPPLGVTGIELRSSGLHCKYFHHGPLLPPFYFVCGSMNHNQALQILDKQSTGPAYYL